MNFRKFKPNLEKKKKKVLQFQTRFSSHFSKKYEDHIQRNIQRKKNSLIQTPHIKTAQYRVDPNILMTGKASMLDPH